jgi:hypothetical protein
LAKEQGRKPVKIKDPRAMDQEELENIGDSEGYYDHSKQLIYIRLNSLESEESYSVVETVIHEGRHAYQYQAIEDSELHSNKQEVERWKKNTHSKGGVYFDSEDKGFYRFQATERDANDYTRDKMEQIFTELEKDLGENLGYEPYTNKIKNIDLLHENIVMQRYGPDYIPQIDQLVDQLIQQRERPQEPILAPQEESAAKSIEQSGLQINRTRKTVGKLKDKKERALKIWHQANRDLEDGKLEWQDYQRLGKQVGQLVKGVDRVLGQLTQNVQQELQQVYPELKFKAFSLSDVEKALELLTENSQLGKRRNIRRCQELGLLANTQEEKQGLQIKRETKANTLR